MPERLFTTDQLADLLGTTSGTVGRWIRSGRIEAQELPETGTRITERELVRFLKKRFDIGAIDVVRHSDVNTTKCPGRKMPWPVEY